MLQIVGQRPSSEGAPGTIIAQGPRTGTPVRPGTRVSVIIAATNGATVGGSGGTTTEPQKREVQVPDLIGETPSQAARTLERLKLRLRVVGNKFSDLARGTIVAQGPRPGTPVRSGSTVSVAIATGNEVTVPNVVGTTLALANATLERDGLSLRLRGRNLSNVVPNTVLEESPAAGTRVSRGTVVEVVVAGQGVQIPNVVGYQLSQASAVLNQSRLQLQVRNEVSSDAATGTVLAQGPRAGMVVSPGTTIYVSVATSEVAVPNLIQKSVPQARRILGRYRLGLQVQGQRISNAPSETILQQNPEPGTRVKPGSSVSVVLAEAGVPVPNLVGQTEPTANSILRPLGLILEQKAEMPSQRSAGTVLAQDPPPGALVELGSRVRVVVAGARVPSLVKIPNLIGLERPQALQRLTERDLLPGVITGQGKVQWQNPAPGTEVAYRSKVGLQLAAPPRPPQPPAVNVTVPRVLGKTVNEAKISLLGAGLQLGSIYGPREVGSLVVKQDPRAGALVPRATVVYVEVRTPSVSLAPPPSKIKTKMLTLFVAKVDPAPPDTAEYRFTFSDGGDSGWIGAAQEKHSFNRAGDYQASVSVRAPQFGPINSAAITIHVQRSIPMGLVVLGALIAIIVAILSVPVLVNPMLSKLRLAALANLKKYLKVEVLTTKDFGVQTVLSGRQPAVQRAMQVRTILDPGEQTVTVLGHAKGDRRRAAHG